jgi:hypothetical protein
MPLAMSCMVLRSSLAAPVPTSAQPRASGVSFSQLANSRPQSLPRIRSTGFLPLARVPVQVVVDHAGDVRPGASQVFSDHSIGLSGPQ